MQAEYMVLQRQMCVETGKSDPGNGYAGENLCGDMATVPVHTTTLGTILVLARSALVTALPNAT